MILLIPGGTLLACAVWFKSGVPFWNWATWNNPLLASVLFLVLGLDCMVLGPKDIYPLWFGMACGGMLGCIIGWIFYVWDKKRWPVEEDHDHT